MHAEDVARLPRGRMAGSFAAGVAVTLGEAC